MKTFFLKFCVLFLSVVFIFNANAQQSGELVVIPNAYERALRNPLMGFTHSDENHPWASTTHIYINWNELENHESDGLEKIRDVSKQKFANLANINKKAIVRVILHYPNKNPEKYWPSDMQTDDYTSQQFQDRVLRLIERLGIAWDNDPRVAFVELGLFGKWGEHHSPNPTPEMQKLVGDAFVAAFKSKKVSVRQMWAKFADFSFGNYWDSWAHFDQMWTQGQSIKIINATDGTGFYSAGCGHLHWQFRNGVDKRGHQGC